MKRNQGAKEGRFGVRVDAEHRTWILRAAAKSHVTASHLIRSIIREAYEARHAK